MTRTPTTTDTTVEWEERVTDPDSDSLTLSLVLDAVDDGSGFTNDGTDSSNLSWLSFTKTASTLNDGTLENLVNIVADKSGLNQGYSYRFKITADDGTTAVDRTFTLSIEGPPTQNEIINFVYVGKDGGLEKTSTDHSASPTQVTTTDGGSDNNITYDPETDTIFWESDSDSIYKINPDGTGETQIVSNHDARGMAAGNGYLFTSDLNDSDWSLYRYNQDGSNRTEINSFGTYVDKLAYNPDTSTLFNYTDGVLYAHDDNGNVKYQNSYKLDNSVPIRIDTENEELYAVSDQDDSVLKVFDMNDLSFKRDVSTTSPIDNINVDPINQYIYTLDASNEDIYRLNYDGSQVWVNTHNQYAATGHIEVRK